jgi:predicted nucleic acid-binding protein
MRLSVDSSSLAKRYVQEDGSEEMDSLLHHASELAFCIILVPEIISALNRRQRERILTITDYRKARRQSHVH